MLTSSLVPVLLSLQQVNISHSFFWAACPSIDFTLVFKFIFCLTQAFITSLTTCSSPRRKLSQIWCLRRISRLAGRNIFTSTNQTVLGVNSKVHYFLFRLYPPLSNIQEISVQIAKKVRKFLGGIKMNSLFRWPRKHINRTRPQPTQNQRTRRRSSGLTSTTTTMIRWSYMLTLSVGRMKSINFNIFTSFHL